MMQEMFYEAIITHLYDEDINIQNSVALSEYNPLFVEQIKELPKHKRGWNPDAQVWEFAPEFLGEVEEILFDLGYTISYEDKE